MDVIIEHVEDNSLVVFRYRFDDVFAVHREKEEGAAAAGALSCLPNLLLINGWIERLNHILILDSIKVHDLLELV